MHPAEFRAFGRSGKPACEPIAPAPNPLLYSATSFA